MKNYMHKDREIKYGMVGTAVMIFITAVLYGRYLFGDYVFVFPNMVNDGITQFYPMYVEIAREWANDKALSLYSFANGFGAWLSISNPFEILIVLFGVEHVAYMMGVRVVLMVLLSGWLYGAFLKEAGFDNSTCLFGSVTYALSTQVVIGSCWMSQGEMAVIAALTLWLIERIRHRKWSVLGCVVCLYLVFVCMGSYYKLLYGGITLFYLGVRFVYLNDAMWGKVKKNIWKLLIVMLCLVGVATWYMTANMGDIFLSTRFQEGMADWGNQWSNTFSLDNLKILSTAFFRTLSPNCMGISMVEQYTGGGFGWFSEDPGFYTGVISVLFLVLFPTLKMEKKKKITWFFLGIVTLLFICLPGLRLLANGFANTTFKLSRLWITLFFCTTAVVVWQKVIVEKENVPVKRIYAVSGAIIIGCSIALGLNKEYLRWADICMLIGVLLIYCVIVSLFQKEIRHKRMKHILLAIVVVELIVFNYRFVNNDDALLQEDLQDAYYNDGTEQVLVELPRQGEDGFLYRVNKAYESVMCCDPVAQGYYGTTFYRGGADDVKTSQLLKLFGVPTKSNKVGYNTGTYGYPALSAILNVQYGISDESAYMENGYEILANYGEKTLYHNTNALPIGFLYNNAIAASEMENMSVRDRHDIVLQACVVDETNAVSIPEELWIHEQELEKNSAVPKWTHTICDYQIGTPIECDTITSDEILVVNINNTQDICVNMYWSTTLGRWSEKDYRTISVYGENQNTFVEIANQPEVNGIIFYANDDVLVEKIDEIVLEVYDKSEYSQFLQQNTEQLRTNSLDLVMKDEGMWESNIECDKESILYIAIPYDAPYSYYLNGQECDTIRANYIFTGIVVDEGEYTFEMKKNE